ncbi:MAG: DUF1573 domain-containing protein [Flavobacteriales bacterium]
MKLRHPFLLASCLFVSVLVAQDQQGQARPTTTVQFEAMEHDFGRIMQDSKNPHVFKFRNTGSVPLIIENATGSCGCTVPQYSTAPVPPGEEGTIEVNYSPGKHAGQQVKTVTLVANTFPAETQLRIHAEVLTAEPTSTYEPYIFAPLPPPAEPVFDPMALVDEETAEGGVEIPTTTVQFDAMEHDFGDIYQGSENPYVFRFTNTGSAPLVIENAKGSCGCTVPFYAKEPIMPGETSEIHVVYKPGKQQGPQTKSVTLMANTEMGMTILRIKANVLVVDSVTAPTLFAIEEEHEEARKAIDAVNPGCFVLFPNPTSGDLRLDLKEHIGRSAQVQIHDGTGRVMLQTRIAEISSESSRLDVSAFPDGIYIATVQVDGLSPMSQCFVVNK